MMGMGMMDGAGMRAIRKGMGASQSEMAEALDMTRETVGNMERGQATIERRTALAIRHIEHLHQSLRREDAPAKGPGSNVSRLLDVLAATYQVAAIQR